MAESGITKMALAASLKALLQEQSFRKISVADISSHCGMNRKSFYYHFRDKYDLVIWIFETEYLAKQDALQTDDWDHILQLCCYLYENRDFYRKVLQVQGQNSFSEYFREQVYRGLRERIGPLLGTQEIRNFGADFFADGIVCAILRWLTAKNCIPPERFLADVRQVLRSTAVAVCRDMT